MLIVDGQRLLRRLAELRAIGGRNDGGVTRLAFSPDDVRARELVAGWMREAGLTVETDAATNLIGRTRDGDGALLSGSHLDTVPNGGWLDGAYGVVAAVEVAATLHGSGFSLSRPYLAVAFANEEGANGTVPFTGSRALIGALPADELAHVDDGGVSLAERLRTSGGDASLVASCALASGSVAAMVELHIEQGPVLEHEDVAIGLVDAITGRATLAVHVTGAANHAGTTPMHLRSDAVVAAAHVVLAIDALASEGLVRTATAGHVEVLPNARNVVAGSSLVSVDLRDVVNERIDAAIAVLRSRCPEIAARTRTSISCVLESRVEGMASDPRLLDAMGAAVAELGVTSMTLPSGAGHDAQVIARIAPMAMIFVPSAGGVSHNPVENSSPEQLVLGANTLLHTILQADARLALPSSEVEHP